MYFILKRFLFKIFKISFSIESFISLKEFRIVSFKVILFI